MTKALDAILKLVAGHYLVHWKTLTLTGKWDDGIPIARSVAESEYRAILRGERTSVAELRESFSHGFDNRLLEYSRESEVHKQRADQFFFNSLEKIAEKDPTTKQLLPEEEPRKEAFQTAVTSFFNVIRQKNFAFDKNARRFFFYFYNNKCKTELDKLIKRRKFETNFAARRIEQLPEDTGLTHFSDDPPMEGYHIEQLMQVFPAEMELLLRNQEISDQKQLARMYGTSPQAIRQRVYQARRKLYKFYRANTT
ncbi:MAG: hypothetical protein AAFY91_11175 [Bacteroidota bacterium]